ncbi:MAG: sulfite exporter TauE/SafE family protein [Pseudomonadota bacterium]
MNKNASIVKTAFIGLVVGLVNGIFGSGGGTVLVPCLVFLMGIEDHKAHATAISIILPLSIISSIVYFKYNVTDLSLTLKVVAGSILGAIVGSCLLNRVPINILRKIFGIVMIIAAIRMVF